MHDPLPQTSADRHGSSQFMGIFGIGLENPVILAQLLRPPAFEELGSIIEVDPIPSRILRENPKAIIIDEKS
jgi:hypothetical protein